MTDLFKELRKFKILLIDDDKWIRDSMAMFFEGEGCHLSVCETAARSAGARVVTSGALACAVFVSVSWLCREKFPA